MLELAELLLQEIPMGPSPSAAAPLITPVEETRLKLRNDIVEYTQLILDRKHRLNSLAPTGVLPPELLAEVFMYLAHALDHNDRVDRKPSIPLIRPICELSANPYGWIKVTHVCHHWREVALSAPQLWSTIWVTNRTECITEMIARSKKVPLTIKAGRTNGPLRNDGVDLVMAHLPRIVSFDARMPPRLDQNKVYSKDAGKLKELVLQTTYEIISPGSLHLQEYFASCEIEKLERLELYAYQVQWDNKLFKSSLKHLVLHGSHAHNHNAVALEQVLRALENLPLLEYLDLTSCLPLPQDALGHSNRIVQLPKLRKLHVFSKALACHSFLRHTSFPADTSITVNCHLFRNDEVNMLLSAIRERSHYRTHDDQPLVQLPPLPSIDLRMILQEGTLELRAWTTYHTVSDLIDKPNSKIPSSSSDPLISIILRHNTNISLFTLLRAVPIDDVESLVMVGDYGTGRSEKAEWTRTFEKMPKLRELGLGEFAKDHVHQVLDHRVPCEQDGPTSTTATGKKSRRKKQFCMPNLTLLRLQDFRENVSDAFMKRMTRSLETRKKAKVGLGTLVIKDCMNWDEESAGALKKFVGSLEYSRRFREYWESTDEYEEDHFDDYEFGGPQPHGFFGDAFMPFFGGLFADDFDDSEEEEDEEAMFGW